MAKFYGAIGYVEASETVPGVCKEIATEHNYYGDVIRDAQRWQSAEKLNDDISLNSTISIMADSYAYSNLQLMRYVKWMGASWKITGVEIQRPRIILTIGGVYNGPTA